MTEVQRVQGRAGDACGVQWFHAQILEIQGETFGNGHVISSGAQQQQQQQTAQQLQTVHDAASSAIA